LARSGGEVVVVAVVVVEPAVVAVVVPDVVFVGAGVGEGDGPVVEGAESVDVGLASSDVHAPTTTVAPSARNVRRDSRFTGRS
jgi:hypothetical protein